jgi:hypothetical protein
VLSNKPSLQVFCEKYYVKSFLTSRKLSLNL